MKNNKPISIIMHDKTTGEKMYIYLIKYNNIPIAAAEDDERADAVINQYMRNDKTIDIKLFEKEAIRYFNKEKTDEL